MEQPKPTFTFNGYHMSWYSPARRRRQNVFVESYDIISADAVRVNHDGGVMILERGHSSFFGCMQAARDCNGLEPLYTLDQFAAIYAA